MRITIVAPGSRGDVQPYLALGHGLRQAGHAVRLLTHLNYEALASAHGLEFWPVELDMQALIETDRMREVLESGKLLSSLALMGKVMRTGAAHLGERALAASQGADLVVAGIGGLFVGLAVAESLGLPFLQALNVPFTPTRAFPGALVPGVPGWFGGALRRVSHHLTRQMVWQASRPTDAIVRRQVLGLPPSPLLGPFGAGGLAERPLLYGISPAVLPPPADWGAQVRLTGYWFLDPEPGWTPPPALEAFLQAGPPPVYVGFGSMSNRHPQETATLVIRALQEAGQRAVVFAGWGGLAPSALPESVLMVPGLPHTWLLPRMAAVVHHGGAGTTAASLRAGVPTVVVPFHGDQPFWGTRVLDLGVGPAPIPRHKLTVARLADALRQAATDATMRARAADLGARIRAEDGVGNAVAAIEGLFGGGR